MADGTKGRGWALGTGLAEIFGSSGRPPARGNGTLAGTGAETGAGGGDWGAGGGDVMSERDMRSPSVVAERGAITFGAMVGADIGVGVENRLIS